MALAGTTCAPTVWKSTAAAPYFEPSWQRGEQEITFDLAIDDINLNVNQAIPCGLIINELVTNAYQHGVEKGQEGQVSVTLIETPFDC